MYMIKVTRTPATRYAIKIEVPAIWMPTPTPRNSPAPMAEPSPIIVKCLVFNLFDSELLIAHFSFILVLAVRNVTRLICPDQQRRSEEHTSELQSRGHLVCRLLLERQNRTNSVRVD